MPQFFSMQHSPFLNFIRFLRYPRRMEDLTLFTRHVAGAMNTRAPLPIILRAFSTDAEAGRLAQAVHEIADRVESGVELSAAMDAQPRIFPSAYRRLVRLGEQTRTLGRVMGQLAESMERSLKLTEFFRRAAIYPFLVLLFLFCIVSFIAANIVPKFVLIFQELGMEAFAPSFFENFSAVLLLFAGFLVVVIGMVVAAALGLRIKFFNYGRLPLLLPIVGPVLRIGEAARFADYLALLLENRIPLAESIGLLADASENEYVRGTIREFHDRFQSGERLSDLIASQPLFPAGMAAIVAHAEDQGALADTLHHLARFYADRTTHGLQTLRELFEPLILVCVGVTVGIVVLAVYLPLFYIPRSMM